MKNKIKITRGKATDDIIRRILIDFYVNSPVFKIAQEFQGSLLAFDDPNLNKKTKREFDESEKPFSLDIFTQEDNDRINFACYSLNKIIEKVNRSTKDPLGKQKGDLTSDSFFALKNWEENAKWSLKEVKDKYNLSYPTLKNRLPVFFDIKTITQGKSHFKYLFPKEEVLIQLSRYYAERKAVKKGKNIYLEIVDLFKDVEI